MDEARFPLTFAVVAGKARRAGAVEGVHAGPARATMLARIRIAGVQLVARDAPGTAADAGVVVAAVNAGGRWRARVRLAEVHLRQGQGVTELLSAARSPTGHS